MGNVPILEEKKSVRDDANWERNVKKVLNDCVSGFYKKKSNMAENGHFQIFRLEYFEILTCWKNFDIGFLFRTQNPLE